MEQNSNRYVDSNSDRIESLKKRLYSKTGADIIERGKAPLREKPFHVSSDWQHPQENAASAYEMPTRSRNTFFIALLVVSIVFFVGAVVFASYMFLRGGNTVSSDNVDIAVGGPVQIGGGEELAIDITVSNNNPTQLELADLAIEYPDGTRQANDVTQDLKRTRENLGSISASGAVKKTVKAILFGEENSKQSINITLDYRVPGSNAIFQKKKTFDIFLSSAPVSVAVDGVNELSSHEQAKLKVTVTSNSSSKINNFLLKADYPFGFTPISTDPKATYDTNEWNLGTLDPKEQKVITITGTLDGQDAEERVFRFTGGPATAPQSKDISTNLVTKSKSIVIKKPFIDTSLSFNGTTATSFVADAGKTTRVDIIFINTTPTKIIDPIVVLKLSGVVLEQSSINADKGYYDSKQNTITWSGETSSDLTELAPGATGKVSVSFSSKSISSGIASYKNPEIDLNIAVQGKRVSDTNVPESIQSAANGVVKIATDIALSSRGVYTVGPFKNTGPLPPRVNVPTSYTIVWTLTNTTNAVTGTKATATLPSYVTWLNVISPSSERLTFDEVTRQVIWDIGPVATGVGYSIPKKEVAFQVSISPSLSQAGQTPILVNQASLQASDSFTGQTITDGATAVTTYLFTDPNVPPLSSAVGQ